MNDNNILPLIYKNSIYKETRNVCINNINVYDNLEDIQEDVLSQMCLYYYETLDKLPEEDANKYFMATYKNKIIDYLWITYKYQRYSKTPLKINHISTDEELFEGFKVIDKVEDKEPRKEHSELEDLLYEEVHNIRFDVPRKYDILEEMLTIYLDSIDLDMAKHKRTRRTSTKGLMDYEALSVKYNIHPGVIKGMWAKYKNHLINKYKKLSNICVQLN